MNNLLRLDLARIALLNSTHLEFSQGFVRAIIGILTLEALFQHVDPQLQLEVLLLQGLLLVLLVAE